VKVVLIADDSSANQWLLHELETRGLVHHVVRPDWSIARPSEISSRPRVRVGLVEKVRRRCRAAYFAPIDRDAHHRLARLLACASRATTPVHVVPAWSINSAETEGYLRDLAPDIVLVSGAPMLRPNIYRMARLGTINLHFGISPAYRGMHTLTVPWWRGDYARVGATVHFIDDGVDTGPALLRVYPNIDVTDDAVTAEANIVRETAHAVCQLLNDVASRGDSPPQGQPPAGEGTLIRFHDRRIRAYLAYRWRRWRGERPRPQSSRVERFY
jgi:methionyl-tRNA formyltransferase